MNPDEYQRVRLVLTRQRRQGTPFDVAWQRALAALPPVARKHAKVERSRTLSALEATRDDWELAFERLPPRVPPGRIAARRGRELMAQMRRRVAA
jgi:hypothetical protein